ncbi:adenylyltransferase/sulfurtransferase [Sphingomonas insulae]|uniref:Molybdopterin-synthase adenylyltransferase MoeB n=1 Tax=Sphingomonas insulae TaxID=424800 RepID=A0ABN1HY45_9SPHN|nr:molybdopterin-synthase adenylyltransferase MoeB [Sphingomonas insulae]NIJ29697.1 adenylyltransferase/sulfurtransferase [Sphingomonas insulae]
MTLSDDELVRYTRHIVLKEVGGGGQHRFRAAHVLVVGAGGIGSPAIQYLAAAGIGQLTVVDDDHVDLTNLQRQTIYATADIGLGKAVAAAGAARRINPHVDARARTIRIDGDNVAALLADVDAILDGCDNFSTRLCVADAAYAARVPLVSAAIGQFDGQLGVFRGWEAGKPCYRCFVGSDPERAGASCAEDGVLGPMAGAIGSLAALEVLRALHPFGEDSAGKLLLADTLALRFRTLRLPKDPGCPTCG